MNKNQFTEINLLRKNVNKLDEILSQNLIKIEELQKIESQIRRTLAKYAANDEQIDDTIQRYQFKDDYWKYHRQKNLLREKIGHYGWEDYGIRMPDLNEKKEENIYLVDEAKIENTNLDLLLEELRK